MGQKLSDLKAALSTMENESGLVRKTGVIKGDDVREEGACGEETAKESVSPFENLYGSTSALSVAAAAASDIVVGSSSKSSGTGNKHFSHRSHATKTLSIVCGKRSRSKSLQSSKDLEKSQKKRNHWVLKFSCALLKNSCRSSNASSSTYDPHVRETNTSDSCVCTGFRQTGEPHSIVEAATPVEPSSHCQPEEAAAALAAAPAAASATTSATASASQNPKEESNAAEAETAPKAVIDLSKFNPDDYPIEDCDEEARVARARELAEGVQALANYQNNHLIQQMCPPDLDIDNLTALFQTHLEIYRRAMSGMPPWDILPMITAPMIAQRVHTQIDYIHYLVPDLLEITKSPFYWGRMDRFEADRLLDGKPDGTFLLRDSAQEDYLFSVSFRKYGRSLHARIEEWNHQVSFDSHDPSVYVAPTVCALIEHYNDQSCCMYFEPVLTIPLNRDVPFSLQQLCRAVVTSMSTYDGINQLMLPKVLKNYLKIYHYKQRVCVRRLDTEQ